MKETVDGADEGNGDSTPRNEEDEDRELTVAKYRAFRRKFYRNRRRAMFTTWVLALPVAWLAWEWNAYQLLFDWLNLSNAEADMIRPLAQFVTVLWAWTVGHLILTPLKWYLINRWEVNPEEFGLAPVDEMVYSAVDDNDDVDRHEEKASDVD